MPITSSVIGPSSSIKGRIYGENFFGDGSDGAVVISTNTSLTVLNKNGSYDGDMVVRQYKSLTINAGVTLTTDQPCRGLFIFVRGDCTINGTLSMTARGASANPANAGASDSLAVPAAGIQLGVFQRGSTDTLTMNGATFAGCGNAIKTVIARAADGAANSYKVYTISRTGASGGAAIASASGSIAGNAGSNGTAGQSGGGGTGSRTTGGMFSGVGKGGNGTCFSGGSGSGGSAHAGGPTQGSNPSQAGSDTGGAGGFGTSYYGSVTGNGHTAGGGAGNPGGSKSSVGGPFTTTTEYPNTPVGNTVAGQSDGSSGTGGLIFLIVGGNLTIGASGSIQANGSKGGDTGTTALGAGDSSGGGGSGGGNVVVLYKGSYSNSGSITATGGAGGAVLSSSGSAGAVGGNGSTQVAKIS